MEPLPETRSGADAVLDLTPGVRQLVLTLPEDEGEGLGFRLTRTLWDPYPWVREVSPGGAAAAAGLRPGDCLLQADGKDLLGLPVGRVARLIRGDGAGRDVAVLVWHCGQDPTTDPELLWSCGGGAAGEVSRRALERVLRALACCVCAATAAVPRRCRRDHLYCHGCWSRLERCALCREPLPSKDSPHARNLVAEQVFEAIATEYDIKNVQKRPESCSAFTSPNRSPSVSPHMSPSAHRRGQYQLSLMRKKHVQFNEKNRNYASDPNLHRSSEKGPTYSLKISESAEKMAISAENVANAQNNAPSSSKCHCPVKCKCQAGEDILGGNTEVSSCQCQKTHVTTHAVPVISVEDSDAGSRIPHRLVSRLRTASSLRELEAPHLYACLLSRSLNDLHDHCKAHAGEGARGDVPCEAPVLLVSSPPVYVLTCGRAAAE